LQVFYVFQHYNGAILWSKLCKCGVDLLSYLNVIFGTGFKQREGLSKRYAVIRESIVLWGALQGPVVAWYSVSAKLFQSALLQPIVEIGLGRVVAIGDKLLGGTICKEALDLGTKRIEFAFSGARRSPEDHSLRLLKAQGLLT
jgi:hypothetical protein